MTSLHDLIQATPYQSYAYAYPHKTAYRPLNPPLSLRELWQAERRDALFLYLHIPFCEMRCGFCNLFTTANPKLELDQAYLAALRREAEQVRQALGSAAFARLAIGGGTPTYLRPADLHMLFDLAQEYFGLELGRIPISVETSPHTSDAARLTVLRERGTTRISIGVQSFIDAECAAAGRSQRRADVEQALGRIREAAFPVLNIDLIYGLPGQTVASWRASLKSALRFSPEELYLYPLYVRPLTGLGRREPERDDTRLECYRAARELLLEAGYAQLSMRMFRAPRAPEQGGPVYCCQDDGMVGLGCGARSYTRPLHYSREYAVSAGGVKAILADYIRRPADDFDAAQYGFRLDGDEQRRRYLIKSLLQAEGLELDAYRLRFGTPAFEDRPELDELLELGLARRQGSRLVLTEAGLERSDTIGPWLYSARSLALMEEHELL